MAAHILAIVLDINPDVGKTNQFVAKASEEAMVPLNWRYEQSDEKLWVHIYADEHPHSMKRTCKVLRRKLGVDFPADRFTVSKDGTSLRPEKSRK